jgi:hypothetical protein
MTELWYLAYGSFNGGNICRRPGDCSEGKPVLKMARRWLTLATAAIGIWRVMTIIGPIIVTIGGAERL